MNASIDWKIPPSVLRWLRDAPTVRPIAALLRHSVCDQLYPGDAGYTLPITEVGARLATELGGMIGKRMRSLTTTQ